MRTVAHMAVSMKHDREQILLQETLSKLLGFGPPANCAPDGGGQAVLGGFRNPFRDDLQDCSQQPPLTTFIHNFLQHHCQGPYFGKVCLWGR